MRALHRLKLVTQLYLAFGLVLAITLFLATFAATRITTIQGALQTANSVRNEELEPIYAAREMLAQTGIAARNAYIFKDEAAAGRELDLVDRFKADYLASLRALDQKLGADPRYAKVKEGMLTMAAALERPRAYRTANDMEAFGRFLVEECSPLRRQIVADIDVLVKALQERNAATTARANAEAAQAHVWIVGLSAIAALLCVVVGLVIMRSLLGQLGGEPVQATRIAHAIASGQLYHAVDATRAAPASMIHAMATMRRSLVEIVTEVRHGTAAIESASTGIAVGNVELSNRTETQAAALAQVANSMKHLVEAVQQNAAYAAQATTLAGTAASVSVEGGEAVNEVVATMTLIHESSKKIVDIISVIDGIAFQTNILALNAAVEAARAGEQGRGFAVVAGEVRNLAQRSAAAAKEIKALIEDSVSKVDTGTVLVANAGETIRKVVDGVHRVTDIMGHISSATSSQRSDIEQVDSAIARLDKMTLENTSLVEEGAAAAESLRKQAAQLSATVSIFQLEEGAQRLQLGHPA
ncbi:methyl-accepting chemotaxis protein [Massilia sp. Leaf139]|uniref:methyl-accepting chemotaxis protein n=1 Tax=Massilia sp. Leaf139 TaxID=1736272 RepID=UPI0006F3684A|nr:methyl-accepting chemotaxis protein [Massilia sp. Leaf139]KQQ91922.1 chemotaxis protein [Massilia sp. Leaf139]